MSDHREVSQQNGQSDPPDYFWGNEQFPCADWHFYPLCFLRKPPASLLPPCPLPHPSCLPCPPAGYQFLPGIFYTPHQLGQGRVLCSPPLIVRSYLPQSLEQLIAASREDLALCPGLGPQKVRALGMGLRGWGQEGAPNKWGLRPQSSEVSEGPQCLSYRWGKLRPREGVDQPNLTQPVWDRIQIRLLLSSPPSPLQARRKRTKSPL